MADAGRFLAAFIAADPGDGGGRDNLSVEFALKILSAQGVDKRKMKPMPSESPEDPMPPSQSMPTTVTVTKTLISTQASTTIVSPTSTPPSATETPVQNADPNSTQTLPADPNSTQTVPADPDSTQTAPAQNSDSSDVPGTTVQTNVGPIIAVSLVAFFIIVLLLAALFFTRRKKQQINNYNIKADQVRIPEDNA
ncbi:3658_t:CDS:2 [Entrophospora sp. SA101]|nr:3658_t:CDS:2 [Entrophospora sp. SA101]